MIPTVSDIGTGAGAAPELTGVRHKALGNYHKKYTSTVGRVRLPHIDTAWNPELTARYRDAALPSHHEMCALFASYVGMAAFSACKGPDEPLRYWS
ncbi:hypothetical protein [Streptomyces chrestomyceticus]|uniref:hypothetical protein n=1 Tax=Streptomyces chrestomyceticus TaxID=68185 RepID=UPI0019D1445E|nr:hypothetical protein [Streptomyces chrestomyceticus]